MPPFYLFRRQGGKVERVIDNVVSPSYLMGTRPCQTGA
jgi:hypothetical protein